MEDQPNHTPAPTPAAESAGDEQRYKTLGIRIDEGLHAQLSFIAQLQGNTVTDEIRQSITAHVRAAQDDPELVARAEEVRAQIEREAKARQEAIAGLFGNLAVTSALTPSTPTRSKRAGRSSRDPGGGDGGTS